jgi:hypothetical protein
MSLRDSKVDIISTRNNDMRGRRIINAGASVDTTDYVIRKELDDAITAISASAKAVPIVFPPVVSTQTVTSNVIGTIYKNTKTTPIFVAITLCCVSSGGINFGQVSILVDSVTPPLVAIGKTFNGSGTTIVYETISFWVLPNYYYQVLLVSNTVNLISWVEWS